MSIDDLPRRPSAVVGTPRPSPTPFGPVTPPDRIPKHRIPLRGSVQLALIHHAPSPRSPSRTARASARWIRPSSLGRWSSAMSTEPKLEGRLAVFAEDYRMMASAMGAQRREPRARIRYHLLADAIVWTDELPPGVDENALRPMLHYRTALIMNEPAETCLPFWQYAKRQFPNWIGFSTDRCSASVRLHRISRYFRFCSKKAIDMCEREGCGAD